MRERSGGMDSPGLAGAGCAARRDEEGAGRGCGGFMGVVLVSWGLVVGVVGTRAKGIGEKDSKERVSGQGVSRAGIAGGFEMGRREEPSPPWSPSPSGPVRERGRD